MNNREGNVLGIYIYWWRCFDIYYKAFKKKNDAYDYGMIVFCLFNAM